MEQNASAQESVFLEKYEYTIYQMDKLRGRKYSNEGSYLNAKNTPQFNRSKSGYFFSVGNEEGKEGDLGGSGWGGGMLKLFAGMFFTQKHNRPVFSLLIGI